MTQPRQEKKSLSAGATVAAALREGFSQRQFGLQNELQLQNLVGEILTEAGYTFRRECSLSERERIDFFVDKIGVGIEVKITRNRYDILSQMRRYTLSPFIKEVILVCIVPITCPSTLADKEIHCVSVFASLV